MDPSRISVIIPALNERESIGKVVASMPWHLIAECIVVDNGSSDGTDEEARRSGARVVYAPRGYGSACRAGAQAALPDSEILVFLDVGDDLRLESGDADPRSPAALTNSRDPGRLSSAHRGSQQGFGQSERLDQGCSAHLRRGPAHLVLARVLMRRQHSGQFPFRVMPFLPWRSNLLPDLGS
jgi:glycosyltransferase involved in cell wall biosynthesis